MFRVYLIAFHLLASVFALATLVIGGDIFLNFAVITTGWSSVAIVAIALSWDFHKSNDHIVEDNTSMGNYVGREALLHSQALRRMRMRHLSSFSHV